MGKSSRRISSNYDLLSYLVELSRKLPKNEAIEQCTSKIADVFTAGPVLVVENGCDQTVFGKGWLIPESTMYRDPSCPGISADFG